ncbi:MAG TPA: acetyltransferase [Gammaproteobacteria bacterium]|nr:acetyltransferase [Gammaproteobacteria bacterium]
MDETEAIAEAVRRACLDAARRAYEQAGISGLCGEGRWEMAMQAVTELDLEPVVARARGRD